MNNNGQDGIQSENSVVTHCTANYNQQMGIHASVGRSRIEGNNVRDNAAHGISLSLQGNDYAIKNVASDNAGGNFSVTSDSNYLPFSGFNANYEF